jgi:lipopolysaccharide/colanic/teichoic acid biosynthesis glycosyltransferase
MATDTPQDTRTAPTRSSLIDFALAPPPRRFNAATFAKRIGQNLIIYSGLLIAAIYACLLVFAPFETLTLSLLVIAAVVGVVLLTRITHWVLFLNTPGETKSRNTVIKWLEDKVFGALLVILFAPLMGLIALLIKLESKGPMLFVQERLDFNNNIIRVFKFRTMYVDPGDFTVAQRTAQNDPRVTRFGRVIRSLRLDELPQLFNVLKGDMSLVGPRPQPVSMMPGARLYHKRISEFAQRHHVKPGIWPQANGVDSEIDSIEKASTRVHDDLLYIEHWSLWLDLKTLMRAVSATLRNGARLSVKFFEVRM